ncbi:hypothetical protein A0H81_01651 [Grifola frondosa]|uniref:Uncharacterized protein n=1 Tax=Grifola frondosa TaxID=5627 RepID=A0A1C7MMF0_GRIFR|nr:hypothetical protein A0H81_01651 [Grifola frondosa]
MQCENDVTARVNSSDSARSLRAETSWGLVVYDVDMFFCGRAASPRGRYSVLRCKVAGSSACPELTGFEASKSCLGLQHRNNGYFSVCLCF